MPEAQNENKGRARQGSQRRSSVGVERGRSAGWLAGWLDGRTKKSGLGALVGGWWRRAGLVESSDGFNTKTRDLEFGGLGQVRAALP